VGNTTITINESDSGTDFGLQVGGGVNVMVTAKAGVRVGADYLRVFSEDQGINMFRFTAGIVLGLP
jgi:opacity protein-like surface antigen